MNARSGPRRPGRPLLITPADLAHQPDKVAELVLALQALINEAGTSLSAIAEDTAGLTNRQALSRSLRHPEGPDEHVVLAVVRHCTRILGEPEGDRLGRFQHMWAEARSCVAPSAAPDMPLSDAASPDPELVAPVLLLISEGHQQAAAGLLTASYPQGGAVLGQVLAEVGRRTPGGVADLIDAVTEQFGRALARAFRQALQGADEAVATAVEAVPRTGPDPDEPIERVDLEREAKPGLLQRTPQEIEGQRRARQVRTGHVAQVVAEIIAEATPTPRPEPPAQPGASPNPFRELFKTEPSNTLDTERAWQLIVDICKQDPDDDEILASILTQTITDGHPNLALVSLHAVYDHSAEEGPAYLRMVQQQMKRPALLSALDHLAAGKSSVPPDTLLPLLAQAPPRVTAGFLLQHDPSHLTPPLDLSDLPRLDTIFRHMIEMDTPAAALVLARQIMRWGPGATSDHGPGNRFASRFTDLACADPDGAGRLLHVLYGQSPAEAARLMRVLEGNGGNSPTLDATAHALGQALRSNPLTASFIARASQDHALPYRLLEQIAQNDATHANLLITAMLSTDLPHFRSQLHHMVSHNAFALAHEMLRQLRYRDPQGPWQDVPQALSDAEAAAEFDTIFKGLKRRQ